MKILAGSIHCPLGLKAKLKTISFFIGLITFVFAGNTFCFEFIRDKASWDIWSKILAGLLCVTSSAFGLIACDVYFKRTSDHHSWKGLLYQYIGINGVRLVGFINRYKLEKATRNCYKTQQDLLLQKLRENEHTKYGQDFGFTDIKTVDAFKRMHPLTRYEHYLSYIERIASGEENVMTTDKPIILAMTSGTSGKSHMIPMIKKQSTFFFVNGIAIIYDAMIGAVPAIQQLQKTLKFFYTPRWRQSEAGIPVGPNSSSPTTSKHLLNFYSTPRPGFDIVTEPEALYVHLLFGLIDKHLGILEANFASLIYGAMVSLQSNWQQLCNDIETGSISHKLDITDKTRTDLNNLLRPNPRRAAELREHFQSGFEGIVQKIWPECNLIFCVDTGSFEHYGNILKTFYCKGIHIYSPIYAATEGLIGINIWPLADERRYLLHPKSMFFEFIPVDMSAKDQPNTLLMNQIEEGGVYELVITNQGGLYRYRFGDVIKVVRFHNQCPVVEFLYRQGQLLNVHGEKTSEKSFYAALQAAACHWTDNTVVEYTCVESVMVNSATSDYMATETSPHYVVFIEVEGEGKLSTKHAVSIDEELRKSYVYESFRKKGSIGSVVVYQVEKGSFIELRDFMLNTTQASANQFKVPRVLRNPKAVALLLSKVVK